MPTWVDKRQVAEELRSLVFEIRAIEEKVFWSMETVLTRTPWVFNLAK
jgi:hypothetical protein